jgi:biotin transport system substrate-specific component
MNGNQRNMAVSGTAGSGSDAIGSVPRAPRSVPATRWPALPVAAAGPALLKVALVGAGVGMLTAGSWLSVPFYPVPLTMQTLAVLLVGGLLGPRLGVAAVLSYLAVGFAGAPVFHNGLGGPAILLGPTGGYLLGFVPAAFLVGLVVQRARGDSPGWAKRRPLKELAALTAGTLLAETVIYTFGLPWLAAVYLGGDLRQALAVGLVPYLLGDALKLMVAVGALRLARRP